VFFQNISSICELHFIPMGGETNLAKCRRDYQYGGGSLRAVAALPAGKGSWAKNPCCKCFLCPLPEA
jgi:hypothetical protein